jgi:putative aminopeptidase FrvX
MAIIGNAQLRLLERLCNVSAVSGDEGAVREIVLEEIGSFADDVHVDALGSVLATKRGDGTHPLRVMLDAHMDEVGLMLVAEDGDGIFRFEIIGGIDVRQLPGKALVIGRGRVPGVIGARPNHLITAEERGRRIPLDALRIDVGPGGSGKVKVGDRATFTTLFRRAGPSVLAKALDDRLGVATLIELLKSPPPKVEICAAFSVQEEIGLRGAKVAAHHFDPALAIVIDATPANDLPAWDGSENQSYNTRLGHGPALYSMDQGTLSDPRLIRFLAEAAEAENIPFQYRQPGGGGTDAAAIHKELAGIPSVSVSVPHRYTHSAISISRIEDWKNTLALLQAALRRIKADVLKEER